MSIPRQAAEWALLSLTLPSRLGQPVGILLVDAFDGLHVRLRSDWVSVARDDDYFAICRELEEDLAARGRDVGGKAVLDWLEESASHTFQIGERHSIQVRDARRTLEELFNQSVNGTVASNGQNERQQKHYRIYVAIGATLIVIAIMAARLTHVADSHRSIAPSTRYTSETAGLLLPNLHHRLVPMLRVGPARQSADPVRWRGRGQFNTGHVHRPFRITNALIVQSLPLKTVQKPSCL
jgi:hypothetical protein